MPATTHSGRGWARGSTRSATPTRKLAFVTAVRGNLLFPADAEPLVLVVCGEPVPAEPAAEAAVAEAGARVLCQGRRRLVGARGGISRPGRAPSPPRRGRKGAALYMPLRSALTGATHGPELAPLVALMGAARVARQARGRARAGRARRT